MTDLRPKPNLYVVRPDAVASLTSPTVQNAIRRAWRAGFIAGWISAGLVLAFWIIAVLVIGGAS